MKIVRVAKKGSAGKGNAEQDAEKLVNGMARITAARIKELDWFADGRFDPMKMSFYEIVLNLFDEELYYETIKFISFVFHANGEHDIGHIVSSVIASTDKTRHEFLSTLSHLDQIASKSASGYREI